MNFVTGKSFLNSEGYAQDLHSVGPRIVIYASGIRYEVRCKMRGR
jgi:hypothetical protein